MARAKEPGVQLKMSVFQEEFKKHLDSKVTTMYCLWVSSRQDGSLQDSISELIRMAHSLAGSGGTFGAMAVSTISGELEKTLKLVVTANDLSTQQTNQLHQNIESLLGQLKEAGDKWHPTNIPYIPAEDLEEQRFSNLIYLAEDDELLAADLVEKLSLSEYDVKYFSKLSDFEIACEVEIPAVIIMDVVFKEGDVAGADVIQRIKNKIEVCPPVIFISVRDDIESRLAAARVGARRYLCKPLNIKKLTQTLDGLTTRISSKPFHILLIDDDELLLEYNSVILRDAGMEVKALSDPMQGLSALNEFAPDVIVLDVYMPLCSGPELAQVIRQDDAWALTPIMFLSSESDLNRQLQAMNLGGDDFLVKPIDAEYLVAAITTRANRSRRINRLNDDLLKAVRESEFQLVAMNQHCIMSTADVSGNIINVNDKFCEVSGYSREELVGRNHKILKSEQHSAEFYVHMWSTIMSGVVWKGVICNKNKSGEKYWVESTIVPFLDEKGKPYKFVSVRTDVTSLQLSEEKYRLLFELSEEPMWVLVNDKIIDANKSATQVLEYDSQAALIGVHPSRVSPNYQPDGSLSIERANEIIRNAYEKGYQRCEWVYKKKSGVEFLVDMSLTRVPYKGVSALSCVWRDITASKEAEAKLRESEERFSFAVEGAGDGVWDWDMHTNKVRYSKLWFGMLGYKCEDLPGEIETFRKLLHPEDAPFVNEKLKNYLSGDLEVFSVEVRMRCRAGNYKWILSRGKVTSYDEEGKPIRMIGINNDVNQRKEAELDLIEAHEAAEEANLAKSKFLSNMSHELRTPMNAIMGYGQLLKMDDVNSLTRVQDESVDEILKASNHLLELINEVLDLSKIEAGKIDLSIETIELGEILNEALRIIAPMAQARGIAVSLKKDDIEIDSDLSSLKIGLLHVDRTRLKQVLLNLLSNAVKYNNENGKIIVSCDGTDKNLFRISVTDTGEGLSLDEIGRLFSSFERLDAERTKIEGTGIGLVITKNIVEVMGGGIGVYCKPKQGCTFWVELPKARS